jgi:hypothetical protein
VTALATLIEPGPPLLIELPNQSTPFNKAELVAPSVTVMPTVWLTKIVLVRTTLPG